MDSQKLAEAPDADASIISPWLAARRQHFDELVGGVTDYAIFMMSPEGIILDWNSGAEELKGYTAKEIVGQHFSRFYSEEDKTARFPDHELIVASAEGRFATEGWRYRKDGTRFWANVTITAIRSDAGVEGFLKITRDLTKRQQATEALRQSEERFRLLIESVADYAIFMLDPEGNVMSWNTGAHRIKGYEPEEIIGQHFSRFYPEEARLEGVPAILLERALTEGRAEDEGWRVRKDGTRFWGNVIITAVHDAAGIHRGFVKITRDLTDRRNREQIELASKRKDTFLATLAHELRNPLAPILPGVDVLLKAPHQTGRVVQVASMLRRQVDQMSRLIDDLLDLSRVTTGKIALQRDRIQLVDVVQRSVETAQPAIDAKHHRLALNLPGVPVILDADLHRLSQAVSNLLTNAAKYTPAGGEIELTVELAEGDRLLIHIKDTGIGIPAESLETIFDLFDQGTRGSSDGLGIGLTLVQTIARMHGGSIGAFSDGEGRGTEMILDLPVVASVGDAPEDELAPPVSTPSSRALRVLVADDAPNTADILCMFFELEGMHTRVAYDGLQAVESATAFRPDLVCLDLGMPQLDGFEAARRIRESQPGVVIIALSGWGSESDHARTKEAGFDFHLVKPVKPEDLRQILASRFPQKG
ncbi:PAS domain-containing hybrid sensor histidine kinase/response regulator [Luteolibacter luteus]|uniref:histidine kinase n=1 Tax=Luteolibacter luteus TaxID=2728835 RepID=A0A858RNY3_9BACT|nr:PAS domain-containing sensor histidine kinase [Luteolibacter luteus]QJE98737.1 PAS domain S-box protein [Luteolibacter luteus]